MMEQVIARQTGAQDRSWSVSTQGKWRLGLAAIVVFDLIATFSIKAIGLNLLIFCASAVILAVPAAVMAVGNARSFGQGNPSRRAWLLIAPLGIVDCVLFLSYLFASIAFGRSESVVPMDVVNQAASIVLGASIASLLSRILLAYVLWTVIGVYRRSGLKLRLENRDYFYLALLFGLLALSMLWSSGAMRMQLGAVLSRAPEWGRPFDLMEYPRLLVLAVCSVLGVVVWRYANQMGGGLVSKAWRSLLLFAAVYLLRFVVAGGIAQLIAQGTVVNGSMAGRILAVSSTWLLVVSEYMLLLAASYQYEACTSEVDMLPEDLDALAAESA
jgi:hypothetical protein